MCIYIYMYIYIIYIYTYIYIYNIYIYNIHIIYIYIYIYKAVIFGTLVQAANNSLNFIFSKFFTRFSRFIYNNIMKATSFKFYLQSDATKHFQKSKIILLNGIKIL